MSSYEHAQHGEIIPKSSTALHGDFLQLIRQKFKQCYRICDFSDPLFVSIDY